jgi:hypothetical protein
MTACSVKGRYFSLLGRRYGSDREVPGYRRRRAFGAAGKRKDGGGREE